MDESETSEIEKSGDVLEASDFKVLKCYVVKDK